jgi:iron complex outermembrane receptor protein
LRNELEKGKTHPFTYSLGSDYLLSENIILKGNVSRNYRIPSFNDLYWKSDIYSQGNPQLKPESGYSGEFGISEKLKAGAINFDFSQTAFGASIKDWIVWVPNDAGIWTPDNKEKGKSYGLEIKGNSFVQKKDSKFELTGFYTWTKAQLTGQIQTNENQMIYIPEHRFMAFLSYTYKQLSASFNINHIGERYYNQENTLPGYQLGNITFDYNLPIKDNTLTATFKVNNLWNTKYNVIANYAMPLRNYQIALKLNINTNY